LNSPDLEQLRQRVIASHHLEPMMASEIELYVKHRLGLVGWTGNPQFSGDAFSAVYRATDGVPRRINALMSRVLLLGAVDQLAEIDGQVVQAVAADMGVDFDEEPSPTGHSVLDDVPELTDAVEEDVVEDGGGHGPDPYDLHAIRDELEDLRRVVTMADSMGRDTSGVLAKLAQLEDRLRAAEARGDEQEETLRRVLTLLVDWVESEEGGARAA
jgi:hypothetical protein